MICTAWLPPMGVMGSKKGRCRHHPANPNLQADGHGVQGWPGIATQLLVTPWAMNQCPPHKAALHPASEAWAAGAKPSCRLDC